ncbi:MAG: lecithin retinol acyltransferase family protein [Deltaproteobacteria bacterium]|jgi:hypothetical protein|nr:lecithin retinol acyltransferase family protein [Deltaproteobacteria bacterium]
MSSPFNPGEHLAITRPIYTHHGIYVGANNVIHYQEKGLCIAETSLEVFADFFSLPTPNPIYVVNHPAPKFSPPIVVERAKSRLNEKQYNLVTNNCEHFCNWCVDGQETSGQVAFALESLVIGAVKHVAKAFASPTGRQAISNFILGAHLIPVSGATASNLLSAATVPVMIGAYLFETAPVISKFLAGDIGLNVFMEQMGGKSVSFFSGMLLGTITQAMIPIPVLGFMVGSLIGSSLSTMFYQTLLGHAQRARQAEARYQAIKAKCDHAIAMMDQYKKESELYFNKYFTDLKKTLNNCMDGMERAIKSFDVDNFTKSANMFAECLGKKLQFNSYEEFQAFRRSDAPLEL